MSGKDNNDNTSMMEMMKLMLTNMGEINSNMNNLSNDISNVREDMNMNINNVRDDMNNDMANVRFESLQERIASRAGSRAVSPSTLQAKLKAKIKVEPIDLATDTPRAYAPKEDISMTAIMKNHEDADAFAHANPMPKQRKPLESRRMNTHAFRDSYAAVNRQNNPTQSGTFTTATTEVTAYLDGLLTLAKCLEFERLLLEYSQRYNIEIRYTNQISNNLKYEIRTRFELTDSQF